MGLTHFPNGISVQGVQVAPGGGGSGSGSGQSLPATTGKYFYVDSTSGSDANSGTGPTKPLAAITAAVAKCRNNKGDVIVVMSNHAQTITAAAGIVLNKAGITVVGLGQGDNKPAITFTTAAGADVDITSPDVTIENIRFVCNITLQTAMLDIDSTSARIKNCDFMEGTATGRTMIDINGGAANACDDTIIENCLFLSTTAGNQFRAIELGEVADNVSIRNNIIIGDWDDAGIHNPTAKILTNLQIVGNVIHNNQATQHAIELVSACTGTAAYNVLYSDAYATTLDPGSLKCVFNRAVNAIDAGSVEIPASADNADNFIGANNADNGVSTSLVVGNRDGSVLERIEFLMDEQSGTAGIATFPAGVQAANLVSLAEVLRYTQEAVRNGTGLALAANKSLVDALGSDGTTVTDVATSVLGAIGAENANNAFASTLVVANRDGSVLERLEFLMDESSGTAGIAVFPAGAQAANAISMAEVLRYAQEAVRNGTGLALAANKSLVDALGSDGTTVTDVATSVLGAIGADSANNAYASTNVVANDDGSVLERLEGLKQPLILARGTFTTSSATVPADTGRTEANGYWTGCYIVPVAGAILGQPRLITAFTNVGGVFTLDIDIPFTAVPGLVAYVITQGNIQIGPAADSTANVTPAHVIGRKTDAVIADTIEGGVATTQSLHALSKAILQRLGADSANNTAATTLVAANRDGSVLERIEFLMDELSGAAGLTTYPAGVAAANGVSMAEVLRFAQENILNGAGTVLPTGDSLYGVLAGASGISTFPASADPANGVSIAEVLRSIWDAQQGAAGVAIYPVGAAAANGVSMAEVLRYAQANIIDGTGSLLPLNSSLYGVLAGAEGLATFPAGVAAANGVSIAESVRFAQENIINGAGSTLPVGDSLYGVLAGASGISVFPAAALPANGVSMTEVMREAYDQGDKAVTSATGTMVNGATVFTITGGPIEILSLVARCATGNDVTGSTLQWSADGTDGAATTISGASASLSNALAGATVIFQGTTLATVPVLNAAGPGIGQQVTNGVVVPAGIITIVIGVGSTTGTWQQYLRYRPLSRGVTVS